MLIWLVYFSGFLLHQGFSTKCFKICVEEMDESGLEIDTGSSNLCWIEITIATEAANGSISAKREFSLLANTTTERLFSQNSNAIGGTVQYEMFDMNTGEGEILNFTTTYKDENSTASEYRKYFCGNPQLLLKRFKKWKNLEIKVKGVDEDRDIQNSNPLGSVGKDKINLPIRNRLLPEDISSEENDLEDIEKDTNSSRLCLIEIIFATEAQNGTISAKRKLSLLVETAAEELFSQKFDVTSEKVQYDIFDANTGKGEILNFTTTHKDGNSVFSESRKSFCGSLKVVSEKLNELKNLKLKIRGIGDEKVQISSTSKPVDEDAINLPIHNRLLTEDIPSEDNEFGNTEIDTGSPSLCLIEIIFATEVENGTITAKRNISLSADKTAEQLLSRKVDATDGIVQYELLDVSTGKREILNFTVIHNDGSSVVSKYRKYVCGPPQLLLQKFKNLKNLKIRGIGDNKGVPNSTTSKSVSDYLPIQNRLLTIPSTTTPMISSSETKNPKEEKLLCPDEFKHETERGRETASDGNTNKAKLKKLCKSKNHPNSPIEVNNEKLEPKAFEVTEASISESPSVKKPEHSLEVQENSIPSLQGTENLLLRTLPFDLTPSTPNSIFDDKGPSLNQRQYLDLPAIDKHLKQKEPCLSVFNKLPDSKIGTFGEFYHNKRIGKVVKKDKVPNLLEKAYTVDNNVFEIAKDDYNNKR